MSNASKSTPLAAAEPTPCPLLVTIEFLRTIGSRESHAMP
jgi:hypothetical protein